MKKSELQSIAAFCRKNFPETVQKVIGTADAVCENRFLFDMPWDLERTEEEMYFPDKIDWYMRMNGDDEFLYQLNRHGFLVHLGQSYIYTGDEKYAECFCRILEDWIERVPPDNGNKSPWRSLEVGIRASNWVKAIPYIIESEFYTEKLRKKAESSLKKHAEVLKKEHRAFQKMSNWGIIQDSGLFAVSAYFGNRDDMALAVERLTLETGLQVMGDGVHWEQSSCYHNTVLSELFAVLSAAQKADFDLSEELKERIYRLALVNLKWIKPDGRQPLFGDSDDNNIRDLLSRSALVFENGVFKSQGFGVLDYDSAWMFGEAGIEKYEKIAVTAPEFENAVFSDSGSIILRNDWSEKSNWLCFHNGFTGGGHAHGDKLHFDLMIKGRDVLVDGGRYTYKPGKMRSALKNASGHNTSIVGNREFLKAISPWDVINPALSVESIFYQNEKCVLIDGGHLGYLKSDGIYTERKILHIKPDIYIVSDVFRGGSLKKYHQFFHFSPDGNIKTEDNKAVYSDSEIKAELHFISKGVKLSEITSFYSPNYNALKENRAVKTSFWGKGTRSAVTVIYGGEKESFKGLDVKSAEIKLLAGGSAFKPSKAEGVIIGAGEKEYTVCFVHEEISAPLTCNGKIFSGRIAVFCGDEPIFSRW